MRRLAAILLICLPGWSIAATVKGKLLDENKEPLVGAHVLLQGSNLFAIVGLDGSYTIDQIKTGNYTVTATFVGYSPVEKPVIIHTDSDVVSLDLQLIPQSTLLSEVTVSTSFEQGSELSARQSEKNAPNVLNTVSAKTIELSPDITVANVVQRVSGVSILRNSNGDPQYAVVRGMDKRYNYTLVNGVKIPSPDNKNRYIPLDIFPASLLERLEVVKALTPAMEGDAIGGAINMVMKNAPEEFMAKGDLQLGYNQVYLDRSFQQFATKAVNYQSPYERYGPLYQAQFSDFSKKNLVVNHIKPLPDVLASLSVGDRFLGGKLGVLIGAGFQNSYRGTNSTWFSTSTDFFGTNQPSLDAMYERTYSTQQTRYAVHAKLDYHINSMNRLSLYTGYYRLISDQTRDEKVTQLDNRGYNPDAGNAILSLITRTRITDQAIFTTTLHGDHKLSPALQINWSGVHSKASNDEPDIAQFERNTSLSKFELQPVTIERHMPRTWQHNTDEDNTGYLNLILTPAFIGTGNEIAAGGMYRKKDRENFYNQYTFDPNPTTQTQGVDWNTYAEVNQEVLNPLGTPNDPQNYKAHENLLDYYLQGKFTAFHKTLIVGGVRVEHTDQGYTLNQDADPTIASDTSQVYTDVLPSINLRHVLNSKMNLRASYYKAITRPGYFEIVPYYNSAQSDGFPEVGNPDLKRVRAHNFDVRWELFPGGLDQLLIGAFFKRILDPIEYATVFRSANQIVVSPGNYGNANNYGIELDYTRYFHRFGIRLNYTFTDSRITTKKALRTRQDPNDASSPLIVTNLDQTRPLQGQSMHIGNVSLLYKDQDHGTSLQLAAVYTGERIESVSPFLDNDSWTKPFTQLDFSAEQRISKHWELTLKGQNLLNSPYEVIIKKPYLSPASTYPYQSENGTTLVRRDQYLQSYRVGVRWTF